MSGAPSLVRASVDTSKHFRPCERLNRLFPTDTVKQKVKQLLIILGPILVTQIGLSLMNFADTVMAGRFNPVDLAGVAIATSIWMPVHSGLSGILLALTPIVAQLLGAERRWEITGAVVQAGYLAVVIAVVVIGIGALVLPSFLGAMGLEPDVRHIAFHYLVAIGWGIIPAFGYTVLRSFMDALGQTRATMAITLLSLPINVLLNYVLIFGAWGFPRLGGIGAGYATALTYWIVTAVALLVVLRVEPFRSYRVFGRFRKPSLSAWAEQLRIGVPIGFSIFFEAGVFAAAALLMSQFGTRTIAAHQAAINFGGLLYMVPMSISMALTIAVGYEVGAGRPDHARQYSAIGIGTSLGMALLSAIGLIFFRSHVAGWYTSDPAVLPLVESFLYYVMFFQISDAVAAPIQGTLRGYKDVNVTLMVALVSYWGIGLPGGYVLANFTSMGPYGYWIGLITGLAAGAVGLALRLLYVDRRYRVQLEPATSRPGVTGG